ncbi:Aste57867_20345 [Aphanomyces stellatus]|uniref:Aste57867_20345 protein n=1 Tax=Aphanomyces stellatus TaxID=120398 RepID=A0A485LJF4_9STRA|nr:hypothetical protein As57867_020279 [Aphanomyces stellatus]VFT97032.1 Aste57867_20345 [Aphanomyces stellatus]
MTEALLAKGEPFEVAYTQRDLLIYALGIGCGYYPKAEKEAHADLRYTSELNDNFAAFPLYPVALVFKGTSQDTVPYPPPTLAWFPDGMPAHNPMGTLHAEQSIEIHRPLPPAGAKLTVERRAIALHPKGKANALMESEFKIVDDQGLPLCTLVMGSFLRGVEPFDGVGPKAPKKPTMPTRAPDAVLALPTSVSQASIYRLSGDYNPLHVDPEMAQALGFQEPILHGLCSMGVAARALVHLCCDNDPRGFRKMSVRMTKPCLPGETLETRIWRREGTSSVFFQTRVVERDVVILDGGEFVFGPVARL